jgi:peptidoglycan hydrolase-like protein with peptidoglycan-binding domain
MALSAIILTGGVVNQNTPAAEAAGLPYCTYATWYTRDNVSIGGKWRTAGFHLPDAWGFNRNCKNDINNQNALDAVKVIQNAANTQIYKSGLNKDGRYGPKTAQAVKNMQIVGGLPKSQQDSVWGPVTCGRTWFPLQTPAGYSIQLTSCLFYVPGVA